MGYVLTNKLEARLRPRDSVERAGTIKLEGAVTWLPNK
jgi:hypothetical protein